MRRLVIDARLAGHSGIGVYLEQMLPRVAPALAEWRPLILTRDATRHALMEALPGRPEVAVWNVPPLTVRCLVATPPRVTEKDLLWVPHFNVPLRSSVPLAVTLQDLLPLSAPALAGRGRAVPLRWWLRAIRSRAQAVFCISEFTRNEAIRFGVCTMDQAVVTPLGVSPHWGGPASTEPVGRTDVPTIIFVGLLKPHKNVSRLLRAFDSVRDTIPHRLVLVARHSDLRNVDSAARTLMTRLAQRVELLENLTPQALVARVKAASFAVVPSLHEGFGLPALEAMAAGTPVLVSRIPALQEVCGSAALYCDPLSEVDIAQGLVRLANDPALRDQLAGAGRARAATFSWDTCATSTIAGLDRALRLPPATAS